MSTPEDEPPKVAVDVTETVRPAPPRAVPQAAVGGLTAGRIATYIAAAGGLATALAPAIANLDITSTVGIVGGMGAIAAVVVKFLDGWQKYEQDVRDPEKYNEPAP